MPMNVSNLRVRVHDLPSHTQKKSLSVHKYLANDSWDDVFERDFMQNFSDEQLLVTRPSECIVIEPTPKRELSLQGITSFMAGLFGKSIKNATAEPQESVLVSTLAVVEDFKSRPLSRCQSFFYANELDLLESSFDSALSIDIIQIHEKSTRLGQVASDSAYASLDVHKKASIQNLVEKVKRSPLYIESPQQIESNLKEKRADLIEQTRYNEQCVNAVTGRCLILNSEIFKLEYKAAYRDEAMRSFFADVNVIKDTGRAKRYQTRECFQIVHERLFEQYEKVDCDTESDAVLESNIMTLKGLLLERRFVYANLMNKRDDLLRLSQELNAITDPYLKSQHEANLRNYDRV